MQRAFYPLASLFLSIGFLIPLAGCAEMPATVEKPAAATSTDATTATTPPDSAAPTAPAKETTAVNAPTPAPTPPLPATATPPAANPVPAPETPTAAAPKVVTAPIPPPAAPAAQDRSGPPAQILQGGDVIHLDFPGAQSLSTTQQIRRDGRLNLPMIGEIVAEGKTPGDFEKELVALYGPQLVTKEVKVTIVSSSFAVFVNGAVLKSGKIQPDHALTALDAVMEAGGPDRAKANLRAVRILRKDGGKMKTITVDLQAVLDGKSSEATYLQSGDIVVVPEKFQVF